MIRILLGSIKLIGFFSFIFFPFFAFSIAFWQMNLTLFAFSIGKMTLGTRPFIFFIPYIKFNFLFYFCNLHSIYYFFSTFLPLDYYGFGWHLGLNFEYLTKFTQFEKMKNMRAF